MRFHLLTADGREVSSADGFLTDGVTFVINPPVEGEDLYVLSRIVVDNPSGEIVDMLAQKFRLPLTITTPITLVVTLDPRVEGMPT